MLRQYRDRFLSYLSLPPRLGVGAYKCNPILSAVGAHLKVPTRLGVARHAMVDVVTSSNHLCATLQ